MFSRRKWNMVGLYCTEMWRSRYRHVLSENIYTINLVCCVCLLSVAYGWEDGLFAWVSGENDGTILGEDGYFILSTRGSPLSEYMSSFIPGTRTAGSFSRPRRPWSDGCMESPNAPCMDMDDIRDMSVSFHCSPTPTPLNLGSSSLVHVVEQPWWCSDVLWKCSCVGTWLVWDLDHRMLVHCRQLLLMKGQDRWLM